jgi:hypothetical protein
MKLTQRDLDVFRRLPLKIRLTLTEEMREPWSHETVLEILRSRDPISTFSRAVSETVKATLETPTGLSAGLGELGKFRLAKLHRKIKGAIKKTFSKIANKDPLYKKTYKLRAKVMKGVRKALPIIITIAGAVLAPFTGGASLAAAAVLATAVELRNKKIAAAKAVREGKREATAMNAEVDQQQAEVMKQADDFYAKNQDFFVQAGYPPEKWKTLTLDQKVDLIQKGEAGTLPTTQQSLEDIQTAQAAAGVPPAQPGQTVVPAAIPEPPPPVQDAGGTASGGGGGGGGGGDGSLPAAPPEAAPAPDVGPAPQDIPDQGSFTVDVEGKTITSYPVTDAKTLGDVIDQGTSEGDRFEIFNSGQSLGLKIRSGQGYIDVPADQVSTVRGMSHDDVLAMLNRAKSSVSDSESGPAPEPAKPSGGGTVLPILALGGGLLWAVSRK